MRALGLARHEDYLALLGSGPASEWDTLIDEITIGETFFFRYPAQWDAIKDVVIGERRAALGQAPLKALCAGCANGAEPFSLALLLRVDLDYRGPLTILGADISKARLAQAERGVFGAWDLRATPERYRDCFVANAQGWILKGEYKQGVEFKALNLVEEGEAFAARHAKEFDIVICRNVMIYFSAETNRRLLKGFHACLKEGGWFIAGHAEPYLEISNVFRPHPVRDAMLYRKLGAPPEVRPCAPALAPAVSIPFRPREPAPRLGISRPAVPAAESVDTVRRLANAGEWSEATAICRRLSVADPFNPEIQFLAALISSHTGDREAQEAALRRALYIDPDFALAHYHLALASASRGDAQGARRSLRNVFASLEDAADDSCVACGDGLTAADLRQLASMQLGGAA
jgi:chemotaxis protein methyltransferase CheR